ncbi:hypothetical protein JY98_15460 [Exiguobacterium mexicanum]|nr:hypothetical protein JY98_15460 [Exiguobacterium mexicanum]
MMLTLFKIRLEDAADGTLEHLLQFRYKGMVGAAGPCEGLKEQKALVCKVIRTFPEWGIELKNLDSLPVIDATTHFVVGSSNYVFLDVDGHPLTNDIMGQLAELGAYATYTTLSRAGFRILYDFKVMNLADMNLDDRKRFIRKLMRTIATYTGIPEENFDRASVEVNRIMLGGYDFQELQPKGYQDFRTLIDEMRKLPNEQVTTPNERVHPPSISISAPDDVKRAQMRAIEDLTSHLNATGELSSGQGRYAEWIAFAGALKGAANDGIDETFLFDCFRSTCDGGDGKGAKTGQALEREAQNIWERATPTNNAGAILKRAKEQGFEVKAYLKRGVTT